VLFSVFLMWKIKEKWNWNENGSQSQGMISSNCETCSLVCGG
jgi:hypothetical protein